MEENNNNINEQVTPEVTPEQPITPAEPVEENPVVDTPIPSATVEEKKEEVPKKKSNIGIILIILVILVAAGGGVGYFLLNNKPKENGTTTTTTTTTETTTIAPETDDKEEPTKQDDGQGTSTNELEPKAGENTGKDSELKEVDINTLSNKLKVCIIGTVYESTGFTPDKAEIDKGSCEGKTVEIPVSSNNVTIINNYDDSFYYNDHLTRYIIFSDNGSIRVYDYKDKKLYDTGLLKENYELDKFLLDEDKLIGIVFINLKNPNAILKEEDYESYDDKTVRTLLSFENKKLYGDYTYVDTFIYKTDKKIFIYLGTLKEEIDEDDGEGSVIVQLLDLSNNKIYTIENDAAYEDTDHCYSFESRTYLDEVEEFIVFRDYCDERGKYVLYTKELKPVLDLTGYFNSEYVSSDDLDTSFAIDNKHISLYDKDSISIYDHKGKLIVKTNKYKNIASVANTDYQVTLVGDEYYLIKTEDVILEKDPSIKTGVKNNKDDEFLGAFQDPDNTNRISFEFVVDIDDSRFKSCEKLEEPADGHVLTYYYDLKTGKITTEKECNRYYEDE